LSILVRRTKAAFASCALVLSLATAAGQSSSNPADQVAALARSGKLAEANRVLQQWLSTAPDDNDARAWRARIAGWQGRYADAESEFTALLQKSPDDVDLLLGLASVLNAQQMHDRALALLDRACPDPAARPECGMQKASTLLAAGRPAAARKVCGMLSGVQGVSSECRRVAAESLEDGRFRVMVGGGMDLMSFTRNSVGFSQSLDVRLNPRWDAEIRLAQITRFGQTVTPIDGAVTFRPARRTAITGTYGSAGKQDLAPRARARVAVDQGFVVSRKGPVRAVEAIYEQGSIAYTGMRLLTFSPGLLIYLPRDWDCLIQSMSTRLQGQTGAPDWTVSGLARVAFPIHRRWRGSVVAGTGSENFGTVDKLLFRSSRTAGGGVAVKLGAGRQLRADMRYQRIDGGRYVVGYESAFIVRF
jgi:hypothetical protein